MDANVLQARRAVEALRSGVPNRDAVRELGSRQIESEGRFQEKLDLAREGSSAGGVLFAGDFGSGKSHLLEYLRHLAVEENFVASKVVISKETPLHDPAKVFRAAAENAVVPGRHGSALTEIAHSLDFDSERYADFYRWSNSPQAGLNERFPASLYLFENLMSADREFAERIIRFWSGDPIAVGELKRKLREVGEGATWALSRVGQRELALQRFRFVAHMIQAAGFAGWALLLDEVELIGRYSPLQRGKSYAELARWTAGIKQEPIEGLACALAISQDFVTVVFDEKLDLERIPARFRERGDEALAEHAEQGMRVIGNDQRTDDNPLVKLANPDEAALEETYQKLKAIHARAYGWEPPDIDRRTSSYSRQMREYVRRWITEWDLRRIYPEYRPAIEVEKLRFEYAEDTDLERAQEAGEPGEASS